MAKNEDTATMENIVSLAKRRGFVFQGSEIYGGFAGTYDLGPLGVALRKNIVDIWIESMQDHDNIAFLDSSIFFGSTGMGSKRTCFRVFGPINYMSWMWRKISR